MFFNKLKSILIKAASETTAHGLPNILNSEKLFLKIIWLLFFLLSSSYAIYLIIDSMKSFLDFEVFTRIDIIKDLKSKFPAVSICNTNPFSTDFANNLTKKFSSNLTSRNQSLLNEKFFHLILLQSSIMSGQLNDEQKRSLSLNINESLIDCMFSFNDCSSTEFGWFYNFLYGNCYTINSGKTLSNNSTSQPWNLLDSGILNGLNLLIFVGNSSHESISNNGLHIYIHNQSFLPTQSEGINVPVGTETNIMVKRIFDDKLPSPYNECIKDLSSVDAFNSELYKASFNKNSEYKQTNCYMLCKQKFVMETCKCYSVLWEKLNSNLTGCTTIEQIDCIFKYLPRFLKYNLTDYCSNYCPQECDSIHYPLTISQSDFPSYGFYEKLLENKLIKKHFPNRTDFVTLKNSVLAVNIYYEELSYTKFSQLPKMKIIDLISNIGGILGLFIGMSFLTFTEIICLLIEIAILFFESKILKNVIIKSKTNVETL